MKTKRNRIFRSMTSNVRTAPKHIDRKIAERKLELFGHTAKENDNSRRWQDIENKIQSAFKALDQGHVPS
jgi:hypothetical protein